MKSLFISIYTDFGGIVYIYNGFSFISKENIKYHIFLNSQNYNLQQVINEVCNYNIVFISLPLLQDFNNILPIIINCNKTKFVVGGEFYKNYEHFFPDILQKIPNLQIVEDLAETYFDSKQISNDYNYFYEEEISRANLFSNKVIHLSYSLNEDCYWNKCLFCIRSTYSPLKYKRPLIQLFDVIKESRKLISSPLMYRIGTSSLTYTDVQILLQNYSILKDTKTNVLFYVRADKNIINSFEQFNGILEFLYPEIGVESLCQDIVNFYIKGTNIQNILNFIKILSTKKSKVLVDLILYFPYLLEKQRKEYSSIFKEINFFSKTFNNILISYSLGLYIYHNLPAELEIIKYYPDKHKVNNIQIFPYSNLLSSIFRKEIITSDYESMEFYHNISKQISKQKVKFFE